MTEPGLFRVADRQFRPWKNGGGETAEIAVHPPGADFDAFSWRISTAIVAASGPFSIFPGVDRVLAVLDGGAMSLTVGDQTHHLDTTSAPFAFPGDIPASARLHDGALLDFNVMVRRPLRAEVVCCAFDPAGTSERELTRLVLLLEDRAGLARFDLVDTRAADPALIDALAGARTLRVDIR